MSATFWLWLSSGQGRTIPKCIRKGPDVSETPKRDDIICIGENAAVQVNAFYGAVTKQPIVEVRHLKAGPGLTFSLAQTQALMEMLEEAMGFWFEEGHKT